MTKCKLVVMFSTPRLTDYKQFKQSLDLNIELLFYAAFCGCRETADRD